MTDLKLSDSSFSHIIDLPVERIDIADWLFNLPNDEYKRCCPPDHIAVGTTSTDDGRKMSINVERIGETLMIQQYVAEVAEKHHCRMVSQSDAFSANGRTKVQIIWDPQREGDRCRSLRIYQQCRRTSHGRVHGFHQRAQDFL